MLHFFVIFFVIINRYPEAEMIKLNRKQQKFCDVYTKYGGNYALCMQELNIGQRQFDKYMS